VEGVDAVHFATRRGDDQIAALDPGLRGGAPVLDRAHQDPVALREPNRPAHAARDAGRGHCETEARARRLLAALQPLDGLAEAAGDADRDDQSAVEAQQVDAQEASVGVEQRAPGRASGQRRGVLERTRDAATSVTPKRSVGGGDEAERRPEPPSARVADGDDRGAHAGGGVGPLERVDLTGVDREHRKVEIAIGRDRLRGRLAPVGERHRYLVGGPMRGGEHATRGDDDAGADPPAAPDPDDSRALLIDDPVERGLDLGECGSCVQGALLRGYLQIASEYFIIRRMAAQPIKNAEPSPAGSSLAEALNSVGDRWTLLIVATLLDGPRRFGELQKELDGIAPNVLSSRLRELEAEGLVVAEPYSERPPRFVYELTEPGRALSGALRLLAHWGARHRGGTDQPVHAACGTPLDATLYCPTCREPVADEDAGELHYA
jgi:DNA-binding HxlR family transcriptional regulator